MGTLCSFSNTGVLMFIFVFLSFITLTNAKQVHCDQTSMSVNISHGLKIYPSSIPLYVPLTVAKIRTNFTENVTNIFTFPGINYTPFQSNKPILHFKICNIMPQLTYDSLLMLRGPMNTQIYPLIVQTALLAHQNMMLKHDFYNSMHIVKWWTLNPFADILCRRFPHNRVKMSCSTSNSDTDHMVGGRKVLQTKQRDSKTTRGSKYMQGEFLSQFPCFNLKEGELHPITDIHYIDNNCFEFLRILPKDTVSHLHLQVDLVCCIPLHLILHKLTKDALASLPYISTGILFNNMNRASIISQIERHLSTYPENELYSIFKTKSATPRRKAIFPERDDDLRVINQQTMLPVSPMSIQDSNMQEYTSDVKEEATIQFPPVPLSEEAKHKIITSYCEQMDPMNFHESGCAVCGGLTQTDLSTSISDLSFDYLEAYAATVTRKERNSVTDPVNPSVVL